MSAKSYECSTWSIVTIRGTDAASFLHNLCTNDVKALQTGTCCESLFTDVKGKVLHHAVVCRFAEDDFAVVVTSPNAESLQTHLDRYHIREQLEMTLSTATPQLLFDAPTATDAFALPVLNAQLLLTEGSASDPPLSEADFEERRNVARFPLDGQDVDQRNLPQELDRNADLISFTKGCYLGQETVARIDALGHVNQQLTTLIFEDLDLTKPPTPDLPLMSGEKTIGRVTTSAWSETRQHWLALAYVRREHLEQHSQVDSSLGQATILALNNG